MDESIIYKIFKSKDLAAFFVHVLTKEVIIVRYFEEGTIARY